MSGTITSVAVRLNGLSHTDPDDLDMLLVSPDGKAFVFWSDIGGIRSTFDQTQFGGTNVCRTQTPTGGACSISNFTITVADSGTTRLPDGAPQAGRDTRVLVNNTTYQPANGGNDQETFSNTSPSFSAGVTLTLANFAQNTTSTTGTQIGGTGTFANIFNGSSNVNGDWKLYIALDSCCFTDANGTSHNDVGSLTSWSLIITTASSAAATTTTVTSNNNPSLLPANNNVTFTATVISGGNPVTLGNVSFFDDGIPIGTANLPLNASGQASLNVTNLNERIHSISAVYNGATGFATSTGNLLQTVNRATTITGNTFCNAGAIAIPSSFSPNPASVPFPSNLFVTGLSGNISKVTLDLRGYSMSFASDADMLLVGPGGQKFLPFSFIGGATAVSNVNLTLDDDAASVLPSTGGITSGTFRPRVYNTQGVSFPSPAPAGPHAAAAPIGTATFANTFGGLVPNGTWRLFVSTHGASTVSDLTGGWCLTFTTTSDPGTTTTPSISPTPSALNQSTTVAALVTNASTSAPVNAQGTVSFFENSTLLNGPIAVGSNGVASFVKSDFTQGAHFVDANYSGAPGFFNLSTGRTLHYVDAPTTNPSAGRFCNTSAVTFPNVIGASGSPYPTRVTVSGMAGALSNVTLSLNSLSHNFPRDMDMMLSGPNGHSLVVLSDVGGSTALTTPVNLTLDSAAASALPTASPLSSGTFSPNDFFDGTDTWAPPAPTTNVFSAPASSLQTTFGSINPNGLWTLWTTNDGAGSVGGGSLAGGWCVNITTTPPQLTISKTHVGNFTQGQTGAQYTVTVGSSGPGSTVGTITVVDTVPTGLTVTAMSGSGWTCTVATRTCATTAVLAAGASLPPITVTVSVAANASSPLVNSVAVTGGGATGATANDSTTIVQVPDLTIAKTTSSSFIQGGTAAFSLAVTNSGAGPTSSPYTINDPMPTGLTVALPVTGSGWDCTASSTTLVSCVRSLSILGGASAPAVTVNVNVASNAPASVTNTATVSGGGEVNTGNNSGAVTVGVAQLTAVTINVPATATYSFNGEASTGTRTFNVVPGSYVLATTTPQTTGTTRLVFSSWSDAGAIAHVVTVGSTALTITGNFTTQFQLTLAAAPPTGGNVTPASGNFFDSGTVVNVTATPTSGFTFANWTGPVANAASAATTVTMDAAKSVTANFTAQTGVTINVPAGVSYTFNGNTVTGSQTFNVAPGTYVLSTTTPQSLGAGVRAVFSAWSNGQPISHNVTVGSTALTITGSFTTQYQLTTAASPSNGGAATPVSGSFFDSGTVVNVTATANSGFTFANWTGPVANANAAATTVTMDAAKSVTANFTAQTGVTINVPAGVSYTFNGNTVTGSQTFNVAPGTYVLSTTTPQSLGAGSRAVFATWSNGQPISHNLTVGSTALTITGNFTTQYQLTTAAAPSNGGNVTPGTGSFFDSGTVVNVTATANSGFTFANWTGPVANASAAITTVTMSAPRSVTANFTTSQFLLTTLVNNIGAGSGTVSPATGLQNAGLVSVTATPGLCSVFAGWTGATVTAGQVNLTGPLTLTASFSAPVAAPAIKGSLQTIRGTPQRYRQAVSVLNTSGVTADISIILDTFGSGTSVIVPAAPTGLTTACTGATGRAFYTVSNVAPGAYATVTFDFAGPSPVAITYNASAVTGAGPR